MSAQATGRVTIDLDGTQHRSRPGARIQLGGIEREFDATDQGEVYWKEKSIPAQIQFTLVHMADSDLIALRKLVNATAKFICDSGPVYTMTGAGTAKLGDLQNGEVEVTLGGDAVVS